MPDFSGSGAARATHVRTAGQRSSGKPDAKLHQIHGRQGHGPCFAALVRGPVWPNRRPGASVNLPRQKKFGRRVTFCPRRRLTLRRPASKTSTGMGAGLYVRDFFRRATLVWGRFEKCPSQNGVRPGAAGRSHGRGRAPCGRGSERVMWWNAGSSRLLQSGASTRTSQPRCFSGPQHLGTMVRIHRSVF
jgi:hypothetical protein